MAYKKISAAEMPKRSRAVVPRFAKTPEWKAMKADIDKGLKPTEALQIGMSAEDLARYGITNRRTVARFVKKCLVSQKLNYRVKSFQRQGTHFVLVTR